jgi:hypothetical protein
LTKTPAIFLLLCFLSYHFGYYAVYFSKKEQVERDWFERIYGQKPSGLKEMYLEIPLQVAYMPDQEDFQESNGSFEKDGMFYRIIKQRYKKDTLVVVYVPDQEKNQLSSMVAEWAKSFSSSHSEETTGLSTAKAIFPKYDQSENRFPVFSFSLNHAANLPAHYLGCITLAVPDPSSPPPEWA